MKIAFCLYKYFPFGGLQRDFMRIAQEVHLRGHSVRVYVKQWEGYQPPEFEIITVPTSALSNNSQNEQYFIWVQNHLRLNPVDKVVGFNRMPELDIYFAADVCFAEQTQNKTFFYKLTPRYKHYISYEQSVFSKGTKTKILVLTENQKLTYQKHYQTENSRFFILPPGIDYDRRYDQQPSNVRNDFRQEFSLQPDHRLLLQVCSNFQLKGVDRSIQALAMLPNDVRRNTRLFIVGQDNPSKMAKLSKDLGVKDYVRFFGGRSDITRFMMGADLMLHPARREAAGIVILESIIAGLPIITSEVCGYSSYINEANAGVVLAEPFDQYNYNVTLEKVLNQPDLLKSWKENAISYTNCADLYSLAKFAADIILE